MQALRYLFSPTGRLSPRPFLFGAIAVYVLGGLSHWLTTPDWLTRSGLWPFIAAQIVLVWVWFALHAKRLHDAGKTSGLALAIAVLYVLAMVLLLIVADSFFRTASGLMGNAGAASALELILLLYVIVTLIGSPHYDLAWLMVVLLMLVGFAPTVLAVCFSAWAARRVSLGQG